MTPAANVLATGAALCAVWIIGARSHDRRGALAVSAVLVFVAVFVAPHLTILGGH